MGTLVVMGALGLARFGYTLVLPAMQDGLGIANTEAGALATANLIGYLLLSALGGAAGRAVRPEGGYNNRASARRIRDADDRLCERLFSGCPLERINRYRQRGEQCSSHGAAVVVVRVNENGDSRPVSRPPVRRWRLSCLARVSRPFLRLSGKAAGGCAGFCTAVLQF